MARPVRATKRAKQQEHDANVVAAVNGVRRVMRALRVLARQSTAGTGLSAAQAFVLNTVAEQPGISVNDIARATMTDRSSAAAVVDRLVEQGFVTRAQSTEDRRRAVITATPVGRKALRESAPPPTVALIGAVRSLPSRKRAELASGLTALTAAMGLAQLPAGMLFDDMLGDAGRTGARRRSGVAGKPQRNSA